MSRLYRALRILNPEMDIRHASNHPYHNLILAVILRAIQDLKHKDERIVKEAQAWLDSREEEKIFSFKWCCTIASIKPSTVKKMIKVSGDL